MFSKLTRELLYQLSKPLGAAEKDQRDKVMLGCRELGAGYSFLFVMGCVALYGHVPTYSLVIAALMILIEATWKLSLVAKYKAQGPEDRAQPYWRYVIWTGGLYTGVFFGIAALTLLLPLPKANAILLMFSFAGVYVTSCWLGSFYMPTAFLKLVPLTLPLAFAMAMQGTTLYLLMATTLVFTTAISVFYVYGLTRQFSELTLAKIRIEELYQKLSIEKQNAEQAVIDKSSFIAAASHDLRQPLHALGLFLGAISTRTSDEKIHSLMNSVDKSMAALNHLFEGLLDVSRLDAGAVEPYKRHLKLKSLTTSWEDEFHELAKSKGLSLTIQDNACVVYTDVFLLERVLRNLLSNALAYTQQGSVILTANPVDNHIELCVSDTGIGIPETELQNVFNEFRQVDRKAPHSENGFGLGLAIVDRISQLLDYDLSINSSVGQGTQVIINIPAGDISEVSETQSSSIEHEVQPGTRILFIDDNLTILDGLDAAMEGWNTDNLFTTSYDDAIRCMDELDFVPDLVVCDYHLQNGKSGTEAALQIRNRTKKNIPFIIITGDTAIEELESGISPAPPILYKPIHPQVLREAIVSNVTKV